MARLAALLIGLLAGAMLFLLVVLVPFWQGLPPAEFRLWFAAHAPRIGALMFPLGGGGAFAALVAWFVGPRRGPWPALAAVGAVTVAAVTMLVNEPMNRLFAAPGALTDEATAALLQRWVRWHRLRVALGVGSLYAALRACGTR